MLLFYSILFYSILLYNVFSVFILFVSLAHKHLTISFFFHHPFIPLFICLILSPSFLFPSNYHLLSVPGSFHFLSWISSKPCSPAKKTRMCTRTCVCVCVCVSLAVEGVMQCCSSFSKSFLSVFHPDSLPLSPFIQKPSISRWQSHRSKQAEFADLYLQWQDDLEKQKKSIILISGCTGVNSCNLMHTDSAAVKHTIGSIDYATCCVFVLCV